MQCIITEKQANQINILVKMQNMSHKDLYQSNIGNLSGKYKYQAF